MICQRLTQSNIADVSGMKSTLKELPQGMHSEPRAKTDVRTLRRARVVIPSQEPISADDVRAIRESNGVSQAVLALYLGTSTASVTQWEQGLRTPTGAAARLLSLIKRKGLQVLM